MARAEKRVRNHKIENRKLLVDDPLHFEVRLAPGFKIQLAHLQRIRVIARASIRRARLKREQANADQGAVVANKIPLANIDVMKALLAMIYWAEGSKYAKVNGLKFANTDPRFAQVYMSLLRKSFLVDERRFRVRLHLHYYHERKKALGFWSKTLDIPPAQFWKI